MRLFKDAFTRFFIIGFAAGAVVVAATSGIGGTPEVPGGMVPSAVAATAP
jgi:hypothetical protein